MSTAQINPQFLDVDFSKDPNFVFGYKDDRRDTFASPGPCYEDLVPVIPESEWERLAAEEEANQSGMDQLVSRIYDQGQEGSCVANATSQAHEILQALQFGIDKVTHLSAMSLYKRIGSTAQSGAMVSDGMDEAISRGILPLDTPENRAKFGDKVMANTGFRSPYPAGWETTANEFRFDERLVIRSFAGLVTSLFNHHPVVVGRQGHSICYVRVMFVNGRLVVKYANSWKKTWGDQGFGYDTRNQVQLSANWCWAPRTAIVPTWLLAA